MRKRGTVLSFLPKLGIGIIQSDETEAGPPELFHVDSISVHGRADSALFDGERVAFIPLYDCRQGVPSHRAVEVFPDDPEGGHL